MVDRENIIKTINIYTKNGNAIESICELHYNYAN